MFFMFKKIRSNFLRQSIFLFLAILSPLPIVASVVVDEATNVQQRLEKGEIVVDLKDVGDTKYVEGRILISEPPDKVWPILCNPFEFQGKISPRMKAVEVMSDQTNRSVLKVTLDILLIPHFNYIVESLYENGESVQFHRIGGTLKDFRGSWVMNPAAGGTKTELVYCMYIDPGFPVPQWIIREGVKNELPKTLTALRERIDSVSEHPAIKEKRTILAALMKFPCRRISSNNGNLPESLAQIHTKTSHLDNINSERNQHLSLAGEQQIISR
jgi:hypothetical protein